MERAFPEMHTGQANACSTPSGSTATLIGAFGPMLSGPETPGQLEAAVAEGVAEPA
jgi:hypothetical protein